MKKIPRTWSGVSVNKCAACGHPHTKQQKYALSKHDEMWAKGWQFFFICPMTVYRVYVRAKFLIGIDQRI